MDLPPTSPLPSLFVSHGSPLLAVEDSPTGRFLDRLGERLPRPRAIVVASAHFTHARPTVTATPMPGPARVLADLIALQPHRKAELQHLRIGQA